MLTFFIMFTRSLLLEHRPYPFHSILQGLEVKTMPLSQKQ